MNKKIFVIILLGFMAGVFLRSFLNFGWPLAGFFIFLSIIFAMLQLGSRTSKLGWFFISFLFFVGLGSVRYEIKGFKNNVGFLERQVGEKIEIQGIVVDEPDEREKNVRLIIETKEMISPEARPMEKSKVLVYARAYPKFHYGDLVQIKGQLNSPKKFTRDNESRVGGDFDWPAYLAKDDIYFEMFYPEISLVESGQGSLIKEKLFALKEKYMDALGNVIPEPYSAFMGGLTIGAKQGIPSNLQEDFKKTGVVHMVVLSGYNITLVADTITKIFAFLPSFFAPVFGLLGIVLFALLTGASATVVRASFMAMLVILARWTGRIYTITWALFLAAFFMVLQNPKILRFDSSFQLSFMATLALIYLSPIIDKKIMPVFKKIKPGFTGTVAEGASVKMSLSDKILSNSKEIISATVATQIFVLPLLLYRTGLFSVVSLPVNFLVLPFIPVTMFFGFITGGLGMASAILSIPFSWISFFLLRYEIFIVQTFAKLKFASFNIPSFPLWLMSAIYALYGAWFWRIKKKESGKI